MIENRGNLWKRRLFRHAIRLGTIHSCLLAGASPLATAQELPGLPTQSLIPAQPLTQGQTAPSGVGITILPISPSPASVAAPANHALPDSLPMGTGPRNGSGAVVVSLHDQVTPTTSSSSAGLPRVFPAVSNDLNSQSPIGPAVVENDKARRVGPVKLSFGDTGIVDLGFVRPRQEPSLSPRTPELLRPERYSISQTVVLAQAAELAEPGSNSSELNESKGPFPPGVDGVASADQVPSLARLTPPSRAPHPAPAISPGLSEEFVAVPQVSAAMPVEPRESVTKDASKNMPKPGSSINVPSLEQTFEVESQATYSFDMPFVVDRVVSQDNEVCMAFHNGQTVTVIGGKGGGTTLTVASKSGESQVVGVNVSGVGKQIARAQTELDRLKGMIGTVFPDARVQIVSLPTGEIEVKGTTATESDARKILELVRKVCLVPVNDKLRVKR